MAQRLSFLPAIKGAGVENAAVTVTHYGMLGNVSDIGDWRCGGNYRSLETMWAALKDIRAHMRADIIPRVTPGWSTDITPHPIV